MANELEPGIAPEEMNCRSVTDSACELPIVEAESGEQDRLRHPQEPTRGATKPPTSASTLLTQQGPATSLDRVPEPSGTRAESIGPVFPLVVPDFVNWDPRVAVPEPIPDIRDRRGRKKPAPFVPWKLRKAFGYLGLVAQRRNPATIPACAIGAVVWGADRSEWPKNWFRVIFTPKSPQHPPELPRAEKVRRTRELRAERSKKGWVCPTDCPFHGEPRHRHVTWTFDNWGLGRIKLLWCGKNPDGSDQFDLTNKCTKVEAEQLRKKLDSDIGAGQSYKRTLRAGGEYGRAAACEHELHQMQKQLRRAREGGRKVEGLRPIYLPAWMFAPSPRMGLTPTQQNLFIALTLECTRDAKTKHKPNAMRSATCPYLEPLTAYVGFNGNGAGARARLRGHGYKPATWMKKAAYTTGSPVGDFISDFAALADVFGLVVTAYRKGAWLTLDEMKAEARTADGRKQLAGCLVRVYTAADYLARWRALFARKLGFSHIPENPDEQPSAGAVVVPDEPAAITTSRELAAWMRKEGLTDGRLAERLGVSRPCIAQYRSGKRKMGRAFLTRLARYTGHSGSDGCNIPVTSGATGVTVGSLDVERPVGETAEITRV